MGKIDPKSHPDGCQARIAELEAENERLKELIEDLNDTVTEDAHKIEALEAKLETAEKALEKMVQIYEKDFDDEALSRPAWLREALAAIRGKGA